MCLRAPQDDDNKMTDVISFYTLPSTVMHHPVHKQLKAAYSFYNVSTKTPLLDLLQDGLILAKTVRGLIERAEKCPWHGGFLFARWTKSLIPQSFFLTEPTLSHPSIFFLAELNSLSSLRLSPQHGFDVFNALSPPLSPARFWCIQCPRPDGEQTSFGETEVWHRRWESTILLVQLAVSSTWTKSGLLIDQNQTINPVYTT